MPRDALRKPSLIPHLLDEGGRFKTSRDYRTALAEGREIATCEEFVIEIEAQLERFRAITGRDPDYLMVRVVEGPTINRARDVDMLIDPAIRLWLEAQPDLRLIDYRDL